MFNQNDIDEELMIPKSAIIVYAQGNSNPLYLENRKIEKTNNGYEMMNGTSLKKSTLQKIMKTIETKDSNSIYCKGIFPKKLLSFNNGYSNESIVWFIKSSWRILSFDKSLGININHFLIPTLVFKIQENVLYVYAAKTDNVDANTKLFKAPFHNVYDDGSICMGNAKIKKSFEINKIMKNYEDAFFLSKFTHLQSQGSPIKGNLNTYLNSNNKIEKKVLIDTKLKVEDLI